MDASLIAQCADPTLTPAVVERFLAAAGSADPLAVTVMSGDRLLVLPKPADTGQAISLVRQYAGHAVVRVGVTQMPAGLGARQVEEIDADLFDPCQNLKRGSGLFSHVMRVVADWYGNPQGREASRLIFEDAVLSWKSGYFEGSKVFEGVKTAEQAPARTLVRDEDASRQPAPALSPTDDPMREGDIGGAVMRVDLSRLDERR
ncbi:conjugal transfer protein TraH [Rhizobium sp. BK379]|jgi:hypothetical protein|uniref:conjugal transfer protein TraH n=1 Tax=Rhizobium sp. BK379 TaxID=2587059 RepID=UPI001835481E|nr:conjugal transfer protein TraH [Rhizobium sp. BK379]MBB3444369.1 hypothetical protein [Rhizobium sp. BK379]